MITTSDKKILLKNIDSSWLKEFSAQRKEPKWVLDLRLWALEEFNKLPWPNKNDKQWAQTDFKALKWDTLQFFPTQDIPLETTKRLSDTFSSLTDAFQYNGHTPAEVNWDYSKGFRVDVPSSLKKLGLEWHPVEEALTSKESFLKPAWTKAIENAKTNKFRLFNLAVGNGGLCLFIPKNIKLSAPLQQYLSGGGLSLAQFPLHFIFLAEGAEAQIWEELVTRDSNKGSVENPAFVSSMTSVHLQKNAKASFYYLQHWGANTFHFQFQDIIQEADSQLETISISVGGRLSRNETTMYLNGPGAQNEILGVLFGDGKQNFENRITQNHNAPHTTSDIQFRGALQGQSKSFFSGMVSIIKEAQKSDAYQSSKSLILSKEARADAIPNLEILADDVKCAHGAAVGPVDEDQKYYFQTRGVPPDLAEKIIIQGFVEPVIAALPSETVQDRLRSFIEEKIQKQ
ncbi:Fe-S cluster assembly protein SufD [bacterium F11]|nr:Fe-S cluster assembly protein SufD [bacterium F11]